MPVGILEFKVHTIEMAVCSRYIETFPALTGVPALVHGFILKNPDIDVVADRDTAVDRLKNHYHRCVESIGIPRSQLATGKQVHGNDIAICDGDGFPGNPDFPDTDGLITATAGQFLGVYVADCGAVFIVDPVNRACGLVHSGRKGTELQIAPRAIMMMQENYGSEPADLIVQVAPCIRPPAYEVDFAAAIVQDCIAAGVPADRVHDCDTCTTSDPDRYYSYRLEKGKTGRLFATVGWRDEE